MEILGIPDTVSKIDFELLNVVPTCITDDSEIYLQCDLVKIYVDK